MHHKGFSRFWLYFSSLALLFAITGCAATGSTPHDTQAQATRNSATQESAFALRIEGANEALRTLVREHTLLRRWRDADDLDAIEAGRLMRLAERDTRELLATQGYFAARVHATFQHRADEMPLVTLDITSGPIALIHQVQIHFAGEIAEDQTAAVQAQRQAITAHWQLPTGTAFTQERWDDAKTAALRSLVAERFPTGRISASSAVVSDDSKHVALHVTLDSGPAFRLGPASIVGAQRYSATLAQRLSWLHPGDIYSQKALVQAQQQLTASGYYDSAYISIDPRGDPAAVPLTYALTEARRHKVQLGAGYSTDSGGMRLTLEHRDNTVLGSNWRSDASLHLERRQPLAQLQLTSQPDASGWRLAAFARHMRQDDGVLITTSDTMRLGKISTSEQIDRTLYLQYDQANVTGSGSSQVPDALIGDGGALSASFGWTLRRFRDLPNPTQGDGLGLTLGGGITTMGTHRPFARITGRWLGFVPLAAGKGRLQLRADVGAVVAKMDARLPSTYLFRTGGDTTVRGYSLRSIGLPVGSNLVAPGRYMTVASIEWQRPILQQAYPGLLEHVLFVDVGSVSNHIGDLRGQWGVGTGLRFVSPVGPMQLDVARGLQTHEWRLHINVGINF